MDNLCHTLVGAALGEAGLARRTRFGRATLMIAANLPDADVFLTPANVPAIAFHRGVTHGVLALVALPLLVTGVMIAIDRWRRRPDHVPPVSVPWLLALAAAGVASHMGLDLLNNYGIRLLAPIDWQWFYGDALFIIDLALWLPLAAGIWLSRRRRDGAPARGALVFVGLYIVAMVLFAQASRGVVLAAWRALSREAPRSLMVGPLPLTPWRRDVIIEMGDHYQTGTFTWWDGSVRFDARTVPKNAATPAARAAIDADPNIRAFLVWSRFPYWTIVPAGDGVRVTLSDMRFRKGPGRFDVTTTVPATTASYEASPGS